jgi:hypothetical protein
MRPLDRPLVLASEHPTRRATGDAGGRQDGKPTLRHEDPSSRYDSEELRDIAWCWWQAGEELQGVRVGGRHRASSVRNAGGGLDGESAGMWRRGSLFNRGTWPADVSETAKQLVRQVITNALLLACPRCPAPSSPSAPQCQRPKRPRRPRAACNKASEPASSAPPAEEVAMSSAQPFARQ